MIFKQQMIVQILAGRKTQTRRPVKVGTEGELPCHLEVGELFEVKAGRFTPPAAIVEVTAIRRERWNEISRDDAIAEGFAAFDAPDQSVSFSAPDAFLAFIGQMYNSSSFKLTDECWVIEFELVSA